MGLLRGFVLDHAQRVKRNRLRARSSLLWGALFVPLVLFWEVGKLEAQPALGNIACASEHPLATDVALAQMRAGGNAVDAAVAAALVAGVVNPSASGIGGGGFAMVWDPVTKAVTVLDFREVAPRNLDRAAFESRPLGSNLRGKAVGIPGEPRGLFELHQKFGKRPWLEVVGPAERYARNGFAVSPRLHQVLSQRKEALLDDAGLSALYLRAGEPLRAGSWVSNPALARTLSLLATKGPDGFYQGEVAEDMVSAAQNKGGALSLQDLKNYQTQRRRPLHIQWEGYDIYTMPPPSAGGLLLAQILGMYSKSELQQLQEGSARYTHVLAETVRGWLADRMRYVGDPELTPVDSSHLHSEAHLKRRKREILEKKTQEPHEFPFAERGTHHLVTADREGRVVSLTTTVNNAFGASISGLRSGVVLNNELEDFTPVSVGKVFRAKAVPNRAAPGARPVSSMTPTLVIKDGRVVLALGGSGGMFIAPNVAQSLLAALAFDQPVDAIVKKPRFQVFPQKGAIGLEPEVLEALKPELEATGETVGKVQVATAIQMIEWKEAGYRAASDPRKDGSAKTAQSGR